MTKVSKTCKRNKNFELYSNELHFLSENDLIPLKIDDLKYKKKYTPA